MDESVLISGSQMLAGMLKSTQKAKHRLQPSFQDLVRTRVAVASQPVSIKTSKSYTLKFVCEIFVC